MRYTDFAKLNESDAGTTASCNVAAVTQPFFGAMVEPQKKKAKKQKQKPVVISRPQLYK